MYINMAERKFEYWFRGLNFNQWSTWVEMYNDLNIPKSEEPMDEFGMTGSVRLSKPLSNSSSDHHLFFRMPCHKVIILFECLPVHQKTL